MNPAQPIVVGISGASGSCYAICLLQQLLQQDRTIDLIVSGAGRQVMQQESTVTFPPDDAPEDEWKTVIAASDLNLVGVREVSTASLTGKLRIHPLQDFSAAAASGSARTAGMVICPCSTGTLSAIAHGTSQNLIHRAADVHLKERRPLILVPRETPFSRVTIMNLLTVTDAGAVVLPAAPGFYHRPESVEDLVDFVVGRICDQLGVDCTNIARWGS